MRSWLPLLRCPATGLPLTEHGDHLVADGRAYPVIDGRPILIAEERSLFRITDFAPSAEPTQRRGIRALVDRLPSDSTNPGGPRYIRQLHQLLVESGERKRFLVVGGGTLGKNARELVEDPRIDALETDVYLGPRTQLICDGHDLPFGDGTFDGVLIQAVLEHVVDPVRVVAEVHRVLKPNGLVYSEIPFIQQVHQGAYDFTRFTLVGHRRLFRHFDEVASGVVCGPGMALAWSLRYFLRTLAGRSRIALALVNHGSRVLLSWLPRLDGALIERANAEDAASGTGFLGRRRETPREDRDILGTYGGSAGAPFAAGL